MTSTVRDRYDVVVIGGGINGTSATRELAAAGYTVLMVEQADFANGATGRSSRLLHCGLRYFEQPRPIRYFATSPRQLLGAVRMAKAAMAAREELVRLQPERCKPFTMCFPVYSGDDISGSHLDLGFAVLKRLGPPNPPLDYRRLRTSAMEAAPFAADLRDQDRLSSIATYREYIIDWPDRLCVDAALDAARDGADVRLFTRAQIDRRSPEGEWIVHLHERSGRIETVAASVVLNLAGTWIDAVADGDRKPASARRPLVCGTKGAHIVVSLPDRYRGYGLAALNRRKMPFYCLPMDDGRFCFGPTETRFDGDASDVAATDDEIDFLLAEANHLLPGLKLARRDVEFSWAGVRPLSYDAELPMGRRTREIHDLSPQGRPGMLAMTAGPVMTHRSAGRELRDAVSQLVKPARRKRGTDPAYGRPCLKKSTATTSSSANDFRAAVSVERARDLRGILYTRTGYAWGRHLDAAAVKTVAESVADLLHWGPDDVDEQVTDFLAYQRSVFRNGMPTSLPETIVVNA
jgi:glycerol-3-phosphate dehydrogenase